MHGNVIYIFAGNVMIFSGAAYQKAAHGRQHEPDECIRYPFLFHIRTVHNSTRILIKLPNIRELIIFQTVMAWLIGVLVLCIFSLVSADEGGFNPFQINTGGPYTESPLFLQRLEDPGSHFLLDGNNVHVTGKTFYLNRDLSARVSSGPGGLLRSDMPPDLFPSPAPHKLHVHAGLGNEVGDPHLQELTGENPASNRTPFLEGFFSLSPVDSLTLWGRFHQNDHFSYSTLAGRHFLAGNSDLAWFGENLPPASLLGGGFLYRASFGSAQGQLQKGWLWTHSPASGFSRPWEGQVSSGIINFRDHVSILAGFQDWKSALTPADNGRWRAWYSAVRVRGKITEEKGKAGWQLLSEIRKFSLRSDPLPVSPVEEANLIPAISSQERLSYPLQLKLDYHTVFSDSGFLLGTEGVAVHENGLLNGTGTVHMRQRLPGGYTGQQLEFFYWNPGASLEKQTETWDLTGQTAIYDPHNHHRGIRFGAAYDGESPSFNFKVYSNLSCEWSVSRFETDSLFSFFSTTLRSGSYQDLEDPLIGSTHGLRFSPSLPWKLMLQAGVKYRFFHTENAEYLDFLPSPYTVSIRMSRKTGTNLYISAVSNYIGPKEVRNWDAAGEVFSVPSHWEHHVSLVQTFLQGRCRFHCTALHLMGRDIREHPNGNPLRFRVLVGGEIRI